MGSVRVAIVGVGNCASSLVQGVEYYKDADPSGVRARPDARQVRRVPRLRRRVRRRLRRRRQEGRLGPLRGHQRLREQHHQDRRRPDRSASTVQRGPTQDGLGKYYRETIEESDAEPVDVVAALREAEVDVLVSYLPVGSEERRQVLRPVRHRRRRRPSSTRSRSSSPPTPRGPRSSRTPASRSSATTSRARSARPSPTG